MAMDILGGLMEFRAQEQDLRSRAALAKLREQEVAQGIEATAQKAKISQVMSKLMEGTVDAVGDDDQLAKQLGVAARFMLPLDPSKAASLAQTSSDISNRALLQKDRQMAAVRKAQQDQANILSSIDSQEAYDLAMPQFAEAGGKPIQGLTGDFAQDASKISQRLSSLMPVKDKAQMEAQTQRLAQAGEKEQRLKEQAQARLDFSKIRHEETMQLRRLKDEDQALRQQGMHTERVARGENALYSMAEKITKPITTLRQKAAVLRELVLQDNPASDKQARAELTGFLGSARATNKLYADNTNFGSLDERLYNAVGEFLSGKKTRDQREYIVEMVDEMDHNVFLPALQKARTQYERIASERGYNPKNAMPVDLFEIPRFEAEGTKPEGKPAGGAAPTPQRRASDLSAIKLDARREAWMEKTLAADPSLTREKLLRELQKAGKL